MEPAKTHGAALPQQDLTRPVGGCHLGPRLSDLEQEGHEGANPHVGQRVADTGALHSPGVPVIMLGDQLSKNDRPAAFTHLDLFKLFEKEAYVRGPKVRPMDLPSVERQVIAINALYPKGAPNFINKNINSLNKRITAILCRCEQLYKASSRNRQRFLKKNKKWLSTNFNLGFSSDIHDQCLETHVQNKEALMSEESESTSSIEILTLPSTSKETISSLDAPSTSKHYEDLSNRSQRRLINSLEKELEDQPVEKLIKVMSKISLKKSGFELSQTSVRDFEFVIKECLKTPTQSTIIAKMIRSDQETKCQPYTADEALCLMIDRKLSVEDYITIQQGAKSRGSNIYPPYYRIQINKKLCYPDVEISISEREATVPLFDLLMHTFRRIIDSCDEKVSEYCRQKQLNTINCVFEGSWGFDGSTGQSNYKQIFNDDSYDEHCLFATTYIPLRVKAVDGFVLWENPSPQSFRYCRPIRIQYRSETKDLIQREKSRVEEEIKHLLPIFAENFSGNTVIGDPKLYLTIIDGKVLNVITNTNSQLRCACCGATCTEFNKLDLVSKKAINKEALLHGLSPLHAWIRIFEFLLHLGYKNDPGVQKWRVAKNSSEAVIVESRKKRIQAEIRQKMGLLVDVVRPNSGTTNDGNTARTALSDPNRKTFARILGIQEWLVEDLHTILVALSSGLEIDTGKFQLFCHNLATKYVQIYNWFYMSVTLHKILIHGAQIIESISLPIGMLSEQAGESRNKFWRYDREHHTRKLDRKSTILDLFHRALESSDPLLSTMTLGTRKKKIKQIPLPEKVISLLKPSTENVTFHDLMPLSPIDVDREMATDHEPLSLLSDEILTLSDDDMTNF